MAQWTFVDPNTLLPGDPWTSAKAQAAFENLEAVAEGAPGAPRVLGNAIGYNELIDFVVPSDVSEVEFTNLTPFMSFVIVSTQGNTRFQLSSNNGGSYSSARAFGGSGNPNVGFVFGSRDKTFLLPYLTTNPSINGFSEANNSGFVGGIGGPFNAIKFDVSTGLTSGTRLKLYSMARDLVEM